MSPPHSLQDEGTLAIADFSIAPTSDKNQSVEELLTEVWYFRPRQLCRCSALSSSVLLCALRSAQAQPDGPLNALP